MIKDINNTHHSPVPSTRFFQHTLPHYCVHFFHLHLLINNLPHHNPLISVQFPYVLINLLNYQTNRQVFSLIDGSFSPKLKPHVQLLSFLLRHLNRNVVFQVVWILSMFYIFFEFFHRYACQALGHLVMLESLIFELSIRQLVSFESQVVQCVIWQLWFLVFVNKRCLAFGWLDWNPSLFEVLGDFILYLLILKIVKDFGGSLIGKLNSFEFFIKFFFDVFLLWFFLLIDLF